MKRAFALLLMAAMTALAGIRWEEETEVTGAALQGMLGKLSKLPGAKGTAAALAPKRRSITYDGGRMATEEAGTLTIIDAVKRTITTVEHGKKTWAVAGFDDAPVLGKKASAGPRVGRARPDAAGKGVTLDEVSVQVTPTGVKGTQAGHVCDEYRVTMGARTSAGAGSVTSEVCAARVPGWEEVRAYQSKAASAVPDLSNVPGAPAGPRRAGEEMVKIDGLPLITRVKIAGGMEATTRVLQVQQGGEIPAIPSGYQQVEHPWKAMGRR